MGNVKLNEKPTAEDFAYAYVEDSTGAVVRVPKEKIYALGKDGGYYTPTVDDDGNLTWAASEEGMPEIDGTNIRGPQGEAGPQGEQGEAGEPGYTPVKGTDYYTDSDKQEMVDLVLEKIPDDKYVKTAEQTLTAERQLQARSNIGAASTAEVSQLSQEIDALPDNETLIDNIAEVVKEKVPLVKSAEKPPIVDNIDKMTDTSEHYVLSTDGYFYAYRESGENYNLFKLSEVSYSSRLQDDAEGIVSSSVYNAVTGWIPVEYGKYYATSILYNDNRTTGYIVHKRMNLIRSVGTIVFYNAYSVPSVLVDGSIPVINIEYEDAVAIQLHFYIADGTGTQIEIGTSELLEAYEPMIVEGDTAESAVDNALNLEYLDGDIEAIAEWYNTGMAYNQPADYEGRVIQLESDVSDIKEDMEELKESMENPASASPYYRNVNFGTIPYAYYQGVADSYEKIFGRSTTYAIFMESWKSLVADHSSYVTETELGTASDGQTVYLYDFKPVRISNQNKAIPKIIIIAGQHGFEKSNIYGLYYFIDNLLSRWNKHSALAYLRNHVELMIIPVLNTYGFDNLTYKNGNGVNLNRNYDSNWVLLDSTSSEQYGGTEPFDQPETQIVRDLLLNNTDASLVIDFHTNGSSAVAEYSYINYYGVCASTDDYYNRMVDAVAYQLSSISGNFNLDYELNQPDTILGFLNYASGTGLLRDYATDNNFVGVLVEGFNGFPNEDAYTGQTFRANEEIITNWLITTMNYLAK